MACKTKLKKIYTTRDINISLTENFLLGSQGFRELSGFFSDKR